MKRFSKILAFILTACMLCGMVATLAFADSEPGYVHPTLTNAAATNITNMNFESLTVGNSYTGISGQITTTRYQNNQLKVGSDTVDGVQNKFWKISLPEDDVNTMLTSSNRVNQRSSYIQLKPNSNYAKPVYYLGVYDSDKNDSITPVTNNFDYITIDFDISAQGARVDYVDGTYGRADAVTKGADGSITVTLTSGDVVFTSADKTVTTVTAPDGTVTVWNTNGNTVTETVTATDKSKVVSVIVNADDGSAVKTVTSYSADDTPLSTVRLTRSATVNGTYTITYDSGRKITVSESYVVNNSSTGENTGSQIYTVEDAGSVTVYTFTDHKSASSSYQQTLTYIKTVDGEEAYSNVSVFPYSSGSPSHSAKSNVNIFNSEVEAILEEFSDADLVGVHISTTKLAYSELSMYNTFRYYKEEGLSSPSASKNNFFYIHYNATLGTWGLYVEGTKSESNRIVTLPDEIGVWNHISLVIEANNDNWFASKAHFFFNGEHLSTKKLETLVASGQKFMGLEDWRINTSEVLPAGDKYFYSIGIDNVSINVYTPTVTYGEDGNVTSRVAYSSGEDVYGVDDFLNEETLDGNLADCKDIIYSASYMLPYDHAYAVIGGEKYYVPEYAVKALNEIGVKNGENIETGIDLCGLDIPEGIKSYNIVCPDFVKCDLSSEAQAYATIEKTETGYKVSRTYIFGSDYRYSSGNNASFGSSGANSAGTYSTLKSVTYGGNAYTQFADKKVSTARYRYDFAIGEYSSSDTSKGYKISNYSYYTVDFDLFADKYVYVDGAGNQVLTDTIPEGVTEYKIAYAEGMNVCLDGRVVANAGDTSYSGSGYNPLTFRLSYKNDGYWHVMIGSTDTGCVLSNELYEVNHFTFAVKVVNSGTEEAPNYRNSIVHLYYNGELIKTAKHSTVDAYDITLRALDWYNTDENTAEKLAHRFSVGIDNFAANFYSKGYTSGEMAGIDDLFATEGADLVDYDGVVYSADYYYNPAFNGYVQVGDGERIYNPTLAKRAIESAADGATITATRGFVNITPNGSLTCIAPDSADFKLTAAAANTYLVIKSVDGSATTYTVRLPSEDDKISVKWIDVLGNVIATEEIAIGGVADATDKLGGIIDLGALTAISVSGWYWDIDGDGALYSEAEIGSLGIKEASAAYGSVITIYPKSVESDISSAVYVAYYNDNGITRPADQNVSNFSDVTKLQTSVDAAPDGSVIKIVAPVNNIVLPKDAYYTYGGKTLTFDLNGKTITRYNTSAYGAALIRLNEGGGAIVTSSVPGTRLFFASKRNSTEEGNSNNRIFGADGIVQTNKDVDSAYIEISNLEFNGGTMVKFDGLTSSATEIPEFENDVKINCKIDNVIVNAPNRSSYAVIATLAPDVVVEVTNSRFYVPDATYAFVHDYANDSARGNFYRSATDLTIKNCEILCYSEGESAKLGKFWYTMGTRSSLYVENTRILAALNGVSAARATWGPGCEIATDKTGYFKAENVVEGVNYKINTSPDATLTLNFKRAAYTTDWSCVDADNGKLIDSCYTDYVEISRSYKLIFVTYTEENVPAAVGRITWKDQNGNVIGTDYGLVGLSATAPKKISDLGLEEIIYDWYSTTYKWGDAESGNTVIKEGENVFAPIMTESVHINGKKANISLTTGMIFNLYIPLPGEGVLADSVYSPDVISPIEEADVDGVKMLKLSFTSELDEFAPNVITICFVTTGGEALSYEVEIDELRYVTLLAEKYTCGTEEAQLAYEIIAYKKAVASYIASANGKTLEEFLTGSELSAIAAFEAVFDDHAAGCSCTSGLYSESATGSTGMPVSTYTSVGISGFAYLLESDENGLRINMASGTASKIKHVSYKDLLGIERVHDEALDNLKFIETEGGGYYVVSGINASDITATITITLDVAGTEKTVTYSLAQYINSTGADVAKALYSYSMAARAYKAIT